ncbi:MAG TPA: GNAT family N-acetyltransferase [Saprospiraceae bacterium]|nr:GNAT family N-acetyltransferase [Saprospiraceae bacterium]HNG88589.1 GNAT family N-acetyltransferase [Saprospiraceae bacterium]
MRYTINTASAADMARHLWACSPDFTPPLSEKVDIPAYAEKMSQRAVNFEAWHGDTLVGMVNAYLNDLDSRTGYITNVSTLRTHTGQGIGAQLLARCLAYATERGFRNLGLEVNAHSPGAVRLYERHGFVQTEQAGDMLKMNCSLPQT